MSLQSNGVSHWPGAKLESALYRDRAVNFFGEPPRSENLINQSSPPQCGSLPHWEMPYLVSRSLRHRLITSHRWIRHHNARYYGMSICPGSIVRRSLGPRDWESILELVHYCIVGPINTLRPRQNGRHFPDDIFKWIFVNEIYEFRLISHWSLCSYSGVLNSQTRLIIYAVRKRCRMFFYLLQ